MNLTNNEILLNILREASLDKRNSKERVVKSGLLVCGSLGALDSWSLKFQLFHVL